MPKFHLTNEYDPNPHQLQLEPSEGDLRIDEYGMIEKCNSVGSWNYVCNINDLIKDVDTAKVDVADHAVWIDEQKQKQKDIESDLELEKEYDDLREAGEYLRKIQEHKKIIEDWYQKMSVQTRAKKKTFETLAKDHTEEDHSTYQI